MADTLTIRTREQANKAISEIAELQAKAKEADSSLKKIVAPLKERRDTLVAQSVAGIETRRDALLDFFQAHFDELTLGSKSVKLAAGVLAIKKSPDSLQVEDPDRLVALLQTMGRVELINTKKRPDINALKRDKNITLLPHLEKAGTRMVTGGEKFSVTPHESGVSVEREIDRATLTITDSK